MPGSPPMFGFMDFRLAMPEARCITCASETSFDRLIDARDGALLAEVIDGVEQQLQ